jgi:outer membrane receptor protein involved in Fe transport
MSTTQTRVAPKESRRGLRVALLRGACAAPVLALLAGAAQAADDPSAAASSNEVSEVTVTASRVQREGYEAPTPTTTVGLQQIQAAAPASVADYVNQLPALVGSTTPRVATTGASATVGANFLNLRSLGANRTLVLLDGHRIAPSTLTSVVDTNLLPDSLVERVDIVTGGASAAWGSDAVAGVVNYVLNRRFTGFKADVQGGVSDQDDARYIKTTATLGGSFLDDRLHVIASGSYLNDGGADAVTSRDWFKSYKVIANPAFAPGNGQPARVVLPNVGLGVATAGGLITGPTTITTGGVTRPNPLRGIQFDADGNPKPFNFGFTSGVLSVGGDAEDISTTIHLAVPSKITTGYGRVGYDITPNLRAFAELGYGWANTTIFARAYERDGNITIRSDNAYLPSSVRALMAANGQTSVSLGKIFTDWGPARGRNTRDQLRWVTGLEGDFGGGWSWEAYYQQGTTHFTTGDYTLNPITANFNNAVDAVVSPATGQILCRSTLSAPTNGCVPFNVFGTNRLTPQVAAYIFGQSIQHTTIKQDVASGSVHGEPFSLPAGPVSVAAGVEWRKESYEATTDPLSPQNVFFLGNYRPSSGSFHVTEGFFETVAPLLKDKPLVHELDFNGAVRVTDYSLSGSVTSWKVGLTWDVIEDLRFRATRSRDIRAPNLSELFQAGNALNQTISDPALKQSYSIQQFASGNTDLKPEEADTYAFGVVYRPGWLPGLSASVDYFDIKINDAIYTESAQQLIDQCQAGVASQCALITRNAANQITRVILQPLNISSEATRGADIEATYRRSLSDWNAAWAGDVTLRAYGTYVQTRSVTAFGLKTEYAGTNANADQNSQAVPRWRWLLSQAYDRGPLNVTLTERYISKGVFNKAWRAADIANNDIPSVTYVDLSASYRFKVRGADLQVFGAVQNLFDNDPPVAPIYGPTGFLTSGTNGYLYDLIGRQYRAGLRLAF